MQLAQRGLRSVERMDVLRLLSALVVLARNTVSMVQIWRARARSSRELAARSERELQDMGTCWSSIADEVNKPFWRA
jgi:uncharacterized protein YjiS (DUF1127 family)